jgi:hypothetical protein
MQPPPRSAENECPPVSIQNRVRAGGIAMPTLADVMGHHGIAVYADEPKSPGVNILCFMQPYLYPQEAMAIWAARIEAIDKLRGDDILLTMGG